MRAAFLPILLIALTCLSATTARAGTFSLNLDEQGLSRQEAQAAKTLLQETLSRIPPSLQEGIGEAIDVVFERFPGSPELSVRCDASEEAPSGSENLFGFVRRMPLPFVRKTIHLNSALLPEILRGREAARTFKCKHKNLYDTAIATVIHELSHLYDAQVELNTGEAETKNLCNNSETSGRVAVNVCGKVNQINGRVSSRPAFQKIRNWDTNNDSKGRLMSRSPDPYEFTSAAEGFAVNMEYFLLDPEFQCRRPALDHILREEFGFAPFAEGACELNPTVYSITSDQPIRLDPKRVWQIHYFWAGPGDSPMSAWGHAMLRIVTCAPDRQVVDEHCLEDITHHVVVSYRAYVDEMAIDYFKGITGSYPSQLLLMGMAEVLNEYTRGELRDVFSIPLNLDRSQIELFVKNVIEQYWQYQGNYKFFTNNCATETRDFLQGVLPADHPFQFIEMLTPDAIIHAANITGLGKDVRRLPKKETVEQGLLFPSVTGRFDKAFKRLPEEAQARFRDAETYLKKSSAEERLAHFQAVPEEYRAQFAPAFFLFEAQIYRNYTAEVDKATITEVQTMASDSRHPLAPQLLHYKETFLEYGKKLLPWYFPRENAGYGVPFPGELRDPSPVAAPLAGIQALTQELRKLLPQLKPSEMAEVSRIERNYKAFQTAK